jgi:hypothetical protein
MTVRLIPHTFENGLTVKLTAGEAKAIERYVQMNGSAPEQVQYHPGHVSYPTILNLVKKKVFTQDSRGLFHFVEGLLPIVARRSNPPFQLASKNQEQPVPMFKIQTAPRIDGLTEDGQEMTQLPYPFFVDNKGSVEFQDTWQGRVTRVAGFQRDLAVQQIDLRWADAQKDPQKAVGMYLVTSDSKGDLAVHDTAVDTLEMVVL